MVLAVPQRDRFRGRVMLSVPSISCRSVISPAGTAGAVLRDSIGFYLGIAGDRP